jgi:hypothetical protein
MNEKKKVAYISEGRIFLLAPQIEWVNRIYSINYLRTKRNLLLMTRSYRAVNTFHRGYKNQTLSAA